MCLEEMYFYIGSYLPTCLQTKCIRTWPFFNNTNHCYVDLQEIGCLRCNEYVNVQYCKRL